jgi:hypothetical protein
MVVRPISSSSFQISSSSSFLHSRLLAARHPPSPCCGRHRLRSCRHTHHILRASTSDGADDCNVEECAPEKEVFLDPPSHLSFSFLFFSGCMESG